MTVVVTTRVLEALEPGECWHLLRSQSLGRIGINRRGFGPLVVPVTYAVDGTGAVVFRTDVGAKLARVTRGAVSFEVDSVDEATRTGWSVLVEGLAHEVDATTGAAATIEPWAPLPLRHAVRIVPSSVTGRRIRIA